VYADGVVLTTTRALGREEGLRVRPHEADALDAELAGWDPSTGLALLRVSGLQAKPIASSKTQARVGQVGVALARSWSNSLTASMGIVSVIGGPLRTGRGRAMDEGMRAPAAGDRGCAGGPCVR